MSYFKQILILCFLLSGFLSSSRGQRTRTRELFSEDVDSFFGGAPIAVRPPRPQPADHTASASIRSANEVGRRPSPFPQLLSPRVIVKNRGVPPAIVHETEPPPPTPQAKTTTKTQTFEARGPLSARAVVHKVENPPKPRRPFFPPARVQNGDRTVVSLPFVVETKDRRFQENSRDFPTMTVQHFPPKDLTQNSSPVRPPSVINSPPRMNVFPDLESARISTEEEIQDGEVASRNVKNNRTPKIQFRPQESEANRFRNEPLLRQLARQNDRETGNETPHPVSPLWEVNPITAKTPQKGEFQSFELPIAPTIDSLGRLPGARENKRFKIKSTTPRLNNSLLSEFTQGGSIPKTPVNDNTRPPVIAQDLDSFFGNAPKRPSGRLQKFTTAKSVSTRTLPTPLVKDTPKALVFIPDRNENSPPSAELEAFSEQSASVEQSEERTSQEKVSPNVELIPGINPDFVDFSTLTTKSSASTSQPTPKISTPKIRTVVHPPPPFVAVKTTRRPITTTTSLPRRFKTTEKPVHPFLSQAHLPFPSILDTHDPTQTFVDVPRVGSRRRTTRKPNTSTRQAILLSTTAKTRDSENEASTSSSFKVNPRNFKTNLLSNQNFQRPIFRDDFPVTLNEDEDDQRAIQSHNFQRSKEDENEDDEVNVVTTRRPLLDRPRPVITVQRISNQPGRPQSIGNVNDEHTWKPVIIQQTSKKPISNEGSFKVVKLRPLPVTQAQRNFQTIGQKKPLIHRKPSSQQPPDYQDVKFHGSVDNSPTETDDPKLFRPALSGPDRGIGLTTPLGTRFQNDPSVEDDFPDDNSYEVDDYDEEYDDISVAQLTTTSTTQRPRSRKPTTRPRNSSPRSRKPTGITRPKYPPTSKPVKPSQAQKIIASTEKFTEKFTESKDSDSSGKGSKCDRSACRLPHCYCGGTTVPGGLSPSKIPQMVLLTFDDAVNDLNWPLYQTLFFSGNTNPNGCPILTTLYVSHEWTDYGKVEAMYAAGHEIASHSISHQDGAAFSKKKWHDEIYGQKEILSRYGGVAARDIRGMRAPFLAIGGNKMFGMLHEDNFTYDSSVTILENNPPSWPYTLDYGLPHPCAIPPCPTQSFPGLWEIPMVSLTDLNGGRCSMADSCSYSTTSEGIYEMLMNNFRRHYESNRAPLGLFYHSSWFLVPHRKEGFLKFLETLLEKDDVYLITSMQLIEWMRNPTPLSEIKNFTPWQCPKNARQPACRLSRECSISFRGDVRSFRTCGECPSVYPWVGKTNV